MQKEIKGEIDNSIGKNLETEQINYQLKKDLEVCQKHLENVQRNNRGVEDNLVKFK